MATVAGIHQNEAPRPLLEGGRRIISAPLEAVIFDQLEYLVNHGKESCAPDCVDCARLERVKYWLLLPFRPIGTLTKM